MPTSRQQGYASLRGYGTRPRYRLWGGYIGNIDRVGSHGRYFGYREHSSGFATGLSRDFSCGSLGGYFAYTGSVLRMRSGNNGRVDADGYHGGLMGSMNPLPRLTLTADIGFAHYENDSQRFDGVNQVSGDFNRTLWTGGLGAQYGFIFGRGRFTPFAAIRYIHLDQDGFTEKGGLTSLRVSDFDGDSFQTELGARLSGEYRFACGRGSVSPYGSVSWQHEFAERDFSASGVFTQGSYPSFRLRSVQRDRDVLGLGAGVGVRYELSGGDRWIGANVGYDASIGDNGVSQSLSATVSFGF